MEETLSPGDLNVPNSAFPAFMVILYGPIRKVLNSETALALETGVFATRAIAEVANKEPLIFVLIDGSGNIYFFVKLQENIILASKFRVIIGVHCDFLHLFIKISE